MEPSALETLINEILIAFSADKTLLYSLMGLTGILFAHRLALWRDRRREFNAVAEEIREALYTEIRALPYPSEGLSIAQRNKLRSVQIGPIRRFRFHYAECHYGDQKWKSKPEVA